MKVFTRYIILIFSSGLIFSCKPTKICPAYHSYFVLDPAVTKTTFSLFGTDSLPRDPENDLWQIDKKKVGIADDFGYRKKVNKQAIISMESIYLKKEDPFDQQLAMAEMDSSMIDSLHHVRQSQKYDDFYNYDQMIYLHYFGNYLPRPKTDEDIRSDLEPEEEILINDEEVIEEENQEKKGFFKRLFGKKNKKQKETEDEEDLDDEEVIEDFPEEEDAN